MYVWMYFSFKKSSSVYPSAFRKVPFFVIKTRHNTFICIAQGNWKCFTCIAKRRTLKANLNIKDLLAQA